MKKFTLRMTDEQHASLIKMAGAVKMNPYLLDKIFGDGMTASAKNVVEKIMVKGRSVELDADGFPVENGPKQNSVTNPFEGWVVEPDPDGGLKGWYSENHGCKIKSITNGKRSVILKETDPLYNNF